MKAYTKYQPIVVTLIFFILGVIGIEHHELWRDEYQAWLIATDSNSLSDLLAKSRYEGHPLLWHIILFIVAKVVNTVTAMQYIHIVIATLSVWLINRYAPFSNFHKILSSFGYFIFYEYAVISRSYALSLFFILLFCVLYPKRFQNILGLCITIFLMANTQTFTTIISIACLMFLCYELVFTKIELQISKTHYGKIYLSLSIAVFGIGVAIWQIYPPADGGFFDPKTYTKSFNTDYLKFALTRINNAWIAIPKPDIIDNWNTNRFFSNSNAVNVAISLLLFVLSVLSLINNYKVLFFYLTGMLGLLLFFYITGFKFMYNRHIGHLFIMFFASFWLHGITKNKSEYLSNSVRKISSKYASWFFMTILTAQFIGGIIAYRHDVIYDFSNAKNATAYIKSQKLENCTIAGSADYVLSSIAGAINKEIYYPEKQGFGKYIIWNDARTKPFEYSDLYKKCVEFYEKDKKQVLLILSDTMNVHKIPQNNNYPMQLLKILVLPTF
jgi:hypothetical protein